MCVNLKPKKFQRNRFVINLLDKYKTELLFEKIDAAIAKLLDLKKQLAALQGLDGDETATGGEKLLKTPRVNYSI